MAVLRVLNCITQDHDLRLVALSACICALGCFTTVMLLARARSEPAWAAARWQIAAALVFGSSVWSLHFVAMLAFVSGLPIRYDVSLTLLSLAVATLGAIPAFLMQRSVIIRSGAYIAAGSVAVGSGVAGMHYIGVAAMRFSGFTLFDWPVVAASVACSLVFAMLALARADDLTALARRVEVAIWFAIGICGLHFTGMTAVKLVPGPIATGDDVLLGSTTLAAIVGAVSLALLLACLAATLMEQHLSQRTVRELGRMRLMSNLAHEVLLIHRDGEVLEMNNAGERLFRRPLKDLVGQPVLDLFADDSKPALLRRERCPPLERRPEEMLLRTATGAHVPVELTSQTIDYRGRPATAVALRDLSDQKRDEARMRHLARHDALTGLANRFSLEERLSTALHVASQDGSGVALLYLDLDRFKPVNDLYGHAAGDALLVQVARRLIAILKPSDTIARIGGDEFVIVLTKIDKPDEAALVGTQILDTLARPFHIEEHPVEIGVSVGVALFPGDGEDPDALLRAADTAMYRVKDEGRNAVRFYEASMNAQLQARRQMEVELARAVERDEFRLLYQPMLNGVTGEVETFEALIRWAHPERGTISPAAFIPVAEQTDLIAHIGRWVIDRACSTAVTWPHPWRVSVNVSPSQFRQSDLPAIVAAALHRTRLDPARLVLEITEGVFIADPEKAVLVLRRLREMGVRLALDDFGTGYSSLSYLQMFRFDKFKIDKSFIRKLGQSEDALTIVRAIVNLGHNLGLQVTAEGVETVQQLAILQDMNCDQFQGYLFGRPAPVPAFSDADHFRAKAIIAPARPRLSA